MWKSLRHRSHRVTPQAVEQSSLLCMATASGGRVGTGNSNPLQAEEETHLISSLQLGVELAEDLLQLFPDHVGENIQTSPAKTKPLLAISSTSLPSRADSDLPSPPITQKQCESPAPPATAVGSPREGALRVSPEKETADPSAQGRTSCCRIPTAAPERAGQILLWDSSSAA